MRGAGRQLLASILNLLTYWVLGLPLAILLGVVLHYGIEGLWVALCITTSVQVRAPPCMPRAQCLLQTSDCLIRICQRPHIHVHLICCLSLPVRGPSCLLPVHAYQRLAEGDWLQEDALEC